MIVGWAVLSPISKRYGWAPGPVTDMTTGARGWILWVALAIMCADSLVSLLPVVYDFIVKYAYPGEDDDVEVEPEERLVPLQWVAWGTGVSVLVGTVLVWLVFGNDGIKPWATVIGFVVGALLSVLGSVNFYTYHSAKLI